MLKSLFDTFKSFINITEDTKKNKEDNKELQAEFEIINRDVRQIASEIVADRLVAAEQRNTADRDRQILLRQIEKMLQTCRRPLCRPVRRHRTRPPQYWPASTL